MFCTECGTQVKENQKFCVKCGAKIEVGARKIGPSSQSGAPSLSPQPTPTQTSVPLRPELTGPGTRAPVVPGKGTAKKTVRLLWVGVAIVALVVGGYFGFRWSRHQTKSVATTPASTNQSTKEGNSSTVGSGTSNGGATTPSSPSPPTGVTGNSEEAREQRASAASAPALSIRSIDFRNFEYHSDILPEAVRVTNGEWRGKPNGDIPGDYFSIAKIVYGDLTGTGGENAIVWTESAFGGMSPNAHEAEIFVFFPSPAGPKLLGSLWPSDVTQWKGVNWNRLTDVQVSKRQLAINYSDGMCEACNDWAVTATFAWNGSRFVRTALTRKPYLEPKAAANEQPAHSPAAPPREPKNGKPTSEGGWGFGKPAAEATAPANATGGAAQVLTQPSSKPMTALIPAGTNVEVTTIDLIDSAVNHTGDISRASLTDPITINGQLTVRKGTDVFLRLLKVHPGERSGRASEIRLVLDHFIYLGQSYQLASTSFDLFGRGDEKIQISLGTQIAFQLTQPVEITRIQGSNSEP